MTSRISSGSSRGGQRGRADQIDEHHGELAALGLTLGCRSGRRATSGWVKSRGIGCPAQRGDGGQATCGGGRPGADAELLSGRRRSARAERSASTCVVAEGLLVLVLSPGRSSQAPTSTLLSPRGRSAQHDTAYREFVGGASPNREGGRPTFSRRRQIPRHDLLHARDSPSCPCPAAAGRVGGSPRPGASARCTPPARAALSRVSRSSAWSVVTRTMRSPLRGSGRATTAWAWSGQRRWTKSSTARQAHHLAADLGEALGAAEDGDEALGVQLDDVAGVVPAVLGRLAARRAARSADSPA